MLFQFFGILIGVVLGAGAFYYLPWDLALAVDALLGVFCLLAVYLKNRLVPFEKFEGPKPLREKAGLVREASSNEPFDRAKTKEKELDSQLEAVASSAPRPEKGRGGGLEGIDSSVFEKFRRNIEIEEAEAKRKTVPAEAGVPDEKQAREVIMALSDKAKSLAKTAGKRPASKAAKAYSAPSARRKAPVAEKSARKEETPIVHNEEFEAVGDGLFEDALEEGFAAAESSASRNPKLTADEFLNLKDFKKEKKQLAIETGELLLEAEKIHSEGQHEDLLTRIEIFEAENPRFDELPEAGNVLFWKGMANFHLKNYKAAKGVWQNCFDKHLTYEHQDFEKKIMEVVRLYGRHGVQKHGVPFLLTALNYFRRRSDYEVMDSLYEDVTQAYEQLDDAKRVVETLRNHISIRKALKDFEGQLDLVDRLGKIFFDRGNRQGTNYCYEQGLRIQREMAEADKNR